MYSSKFDQIGEKFEILIDLKRDLKGESTESKIL